MRQFGFVKWFGAYDSYSQRLSNYGFIDRIKKLDIYVHSADVLNKRYLHKDDLVTFDVELNEETNKIKAVKVKLIEDEDDFELVKKLAFSENERIYLQAFPGHSNRINFEEAALLLKEKFNTLSSEHSRKIFVSKLSIPFLIKYPGLRSYLDYKSHFKICLNLAEEKNLEESEKVKLYAEALGSIKHSLPEDREQLIKFQRTIY